MEQWLSAIAMLVCMLVCIKYPESTMGSLVNGICYRCMAYMMPMLNHCKQIQHTGDMLSGSNSNTQADYLRMHSHLHGNKSYRLIYRLICRSFWKDACVHE